METDPVQIYVSIQDPDLNESRLNTFTHDVISSLNREQDIDAKPASEAGPQGSKGDLMAIGNIALQLLGSGGAIVALLNVMKAYFERKHTLSVNVTRKDGAKFSITAENLNSKLFAETSTQLSDFLKS